MYCRYATLYATIFSNFFDIYFFGSRKACRLKRGLELSIFLSFHSVKILETYSFFQEMLLITVNLLQQSDIKYCNYTMHIINEYFFCIVSTEEENNIQDTAFGSSEDSLT